MDRLTLYHSSTSVCAIKVRLATAEKGLEFDSVLLDLQAGEQFRPEYQRLNPNAVVPTLVHGDRLVIESTVICHYIDEILPDPPLLPSDPFSRAGVRLWMKAVDDAIHPAANALSFATANRKAIMRKTAEEREAALLRIADPVARERRRQLVTMGFAAPLVLDAIRLYDERLTMLETVLTRSDFIAGDRWSLADAAMTPYVNRLEMIGLSQFWTSSRPHVAQWFARMKERPSFTTAITSWFTAADAKRFAPEEEEEEEEEEEDPWATVEKVLSRRP